MSKLTDPGKDKSSEEAKQVRQAAWARPGKQTERNKLRNDRLASWLDTVPEHLREREAERWQ